MEKDLQLEIGERVRQTRTSRGITRETLSEFLGISPLFLGYIECGQRGMSLTTLKNLCNTLNVSADYILLGKDKSATDDETIINAVKDLEPQYIPLAIEQINNLKKTIAIIRHNEKDNIKND